SEKQARFVLDAIRARLAECGLELHPTKTKIVYCRDDDRGGTYENIKFDFLGYSFHPRRAKNRWGKFFVSFLPAVRSGDLSDQPGAARVGELLCGRKLRRVLQLHSRLGGEGSAPHDEGSETTGLRLDAVE